MAESRAVADRIEEVVPGVWHWRVHDERIDYVGAGHAVTGDEGTVLIDPHALAPEPLARLGNVTAICLTAGSHERAAWRLRRELETPVWAPALSKELEEEPDSRYGDGDVLPGGLRAVFTPGAGTTQHTFLLDREGGIAFVPDLLLHPPDGKLELCPDEYLYDPVLARASTRKLLDLPFTILCLSHGPPIADDPKGAIRAALAS